MKTDKPQFYHFRLVDQEYLDQPASKGGVTICFVPNSVGGYAAGVAICSNFENYNKKIGRLIAEGRTRKAKPDDRRYLPLVIGKDWAETDEEAMNITAELIATESAYRVYGVPVPFFQKADK